MDKKTVFVMISMLFMLGCSAEYENLGGFDSKEIFGNDSYYPDDIRAEMITPGEAILYVCTTESCLEKPKYKVYVKDYNILVKARYPWKPGPEVDCIFLTCNKLKVSNLRNVDYEVTLDYKNMDHTTKLESIHYE